MKECKNSGILPCYRDGYGIWHYLDDTHDKVYVLNKQMCDLGKTMNDPFEPLSKEAIQDIAKALEITRNPKSIMEEKKTKKMTKAEAFEYLNNKKVYVNSRSAQIQATLFDAGFSWADGKDIKWLDMPFLFISADRISFSCSMVDFKHMLSYEEISADDILSIEIVDEEKEPLDKWEDFANKVAKIQETLEDDEVCIITKTNYLTMTK